MQRYHILYSLGRLLSYIYFYGSYNGGAIDQDHNSHHCELPLDKSRKLLHQSPNDDGEPSAGSSMFRMPVSSAASLISMFVW